MTTTSIWETLPIKHMPLRSGPKSAFARLFPEKYQQQQLELRRAQNLKSNYNEFIYPDCVTTNNQNINERNYLKARTKSEPYLNEKNRNIRPLLNVLKNSSEYKTTEIIKNRRSSISTSSKPLLSPKPRPIIMEKRLPYKITNDRRVLYQRIEPTRPVQRNLIVQYRSPQIKIKQEIENIGCYCVDPKLYEVEYGSTLRRTDSIRKILENIGFNANSIISKGYQTCQSSADVVPNSLDSLMDSSSQTTEHYYDIPRSYNDSCDIHYSSIV